MVRRTRRNYQSGAPYDRLPGDKNLHTVCRAGHRARRTGDTDKSKALLAEVFKLLGNSANGKNLEAVERQTSVLFTKDKKLVDRTLRCAYFEDLDELGQAYELESWKPRTTINRPFQIGIAVYQLAKLRMLEFYYDFLDRYFSRRDFE